MIRPLLALAGALALLSCAPREPWPEASPALWQVTGPDGQSGWLFGTIHALPDGVEWRTPQIDRALAASDLLVVEVAELGDSRAAAQAFEAVAHSPGLPPLSRRVPPAGRPALARFMDDADADDSDFADTESWAAALLLANRVRQADPANGVDRALLAQDKPVLGLEGHAGQYALFDALPAADQADLLLGLAADATAANGDGETRAWLTGDMAALEQRAERGVLAYPRLRAELVTARNRRWTAAIEQLLQQRRKPFVAVGAGHMLGDDGLPAMLAARGYRVTRVR